LLDESKISTVVFPARTTNILQVLDLVLFGTLKKLKATPPRESDESSMQDRIPRLLQTSEQTGTSMTIRESFQKAGLYPDLGSRPFKVRFDEEKLRENVGFKKLWKRNISIEGLSLRRRILTSGVTKTQFLVT
jgi:hypothetical protein